jgi:mannose-6-phosphate isomerase-like protein (cupin superfamily)
MKPGAIIHTAEQEEYCHPKHDRFFLRDVVTALEGADLSVHRGRIEVGGEICPHPHDVQTETFYILSGEAICTLGEKAYQVSAGHCCVASAGTTHSLKNSGDQPVELLAIFTPPLK